VFRVQPGLEMHGHAVTASRVPCVRASAPTSTKIDAVVQVVAPSVPFLYCPMYAVPNSAVMVQVSATVMLSG